MGLDVDLAAALDGNGHATGVPDADILLALTDAVLGTDDDAVTVAIEAVRTRLGQAALADTAATIASYDSIVKVVDATGVPLEDETMDKTVELRKELGID